MAVKTIWHTIKEGFRDAILIASEELHTIFTDTGVLIIFFAAGLIYPVVYNLVYMNEVVREVPVAVVDMSHSSMSRQFIRHIDATPDVSVDFRTSSLEEAKKLYGTSDVVGIIYIPKSFSDDIQSGRQTHVDAFVNMATMLYYKAVYQAINYVSLDMGTKIQIGNLMAKGMTYKQAEIQAMPAKYGTVALFNSQTGYASFLIPCVLILIIQQTLVIGVGIRAGTDRENNVLRGFLPMRKIYHGALRTVIGRGLAYYAIYLFIGVYNLAIMPKVFNLPHFISFTDLLLFLIPFTSACVFFAMALSVFFYNREEVFVLYLFTSIPLLFMSGGPWPVDNIPSFWRLFSGFFPSTFGIRAFNKLNSMGASFYQITFEMRWLWILTGVYFVVVVLLYRWQLYEDTRKDLKRLK